MTEGLDSIKLNNYVRCFFITRLTFDIKLEHKELEN